MVRCVNESIDPVQLLKMLFSGLLIFRFQIDWRISNKKFLSLKLISQGPLRDTLIQFGFDFDSLWFTIHLDLYSFWFLIQFDVIHFDSVWFWFAANHDSPANHNLPTNQKSKVGESCRIIAWFDFGSKANQSESRIKLIRALAHSLIETLRELLALI